jgi:hypothetical protein
MKTLVWSITHFNATQLPQLPQMNNAPIPVKGMREEEVSPLLRKLYVCVAPCIPGMYLRDNCELKGCLYFRSAFGVSVF